MKANRLLIALIGFAAPAFAHDTWLVAAKNAVSTKEPVRVALATGEVFPTSEAAPKAERVAEFVVVHDGRARKIESFAVEDKELAATLTFEDSGAHIVGLALHANFIELAPKDFEEYLKDEAASAALEKWRARQDPDKPARELYTKYAKTFIEVGHSPLPGDFSRPLGHVLEILPLDNACGWPPGSTQRLRVLFEGKPAAGVRLSVGHEGLPAHTYVEHVTTDANGEASITPKTAGLWFVRTHVIRPLAEPKAAPHDEQARKAEWESFWASITFRVLGDK